ncbi:MAG: hypothetical protein JXR03_13045 [Cyclobacteriaceae bacterium]
MRLQITLVLFFVSRLIYAQVSVEDVLSKPLSEEEMTQVLAREDYLNSHKFNSPWLRELDFRARSNDREIALEDYRLRLSFLNPLEILANRDYRKVLQSQQNFERKKTIDKVLLRRYELLIETNYVLKSLTIQNNYLEALKEIKSIMVSEQFDFSDLVDMEQEITKVELFIANLEQKRAVLEQIFSESGFSGLPDCNDFRWITSAQIKTLLGGSSNDTISLLQISELQKIEKEETILRIKKAEAFSNIGFIQAEYDTERGKAFDDHVGFQVGVTIPVFNSNKPDLQRRELELIEEKADYKVLVAEERQQKNIDELRIKDLLSQSELIDEKKEELGEIRELINAGNNGFKAYRKLAEYDLFLEEKDLTFDSDIYMKYVMHLHKQGTLSDEPYINALSSEMSSFDLGQ